MMDFVPMGHPCDAQNGTFNLSLNQKTLSSTVVIFISELLVFISQTVIFFLRNKTGEYLKTERGKLITVQKLN